jgi:hypothetical protein
MIQSAAHATESLVPMLHAAMKCLAAAVLAIAVTTAGLSPTIACACCSFVGQRSAYVEKFNTQLEQFSFRSVAKLALDERYDGTIQGLDNPVEDFTVTVTQLTDRITFSLRDAKDRAGTLSLVKPQTIEIFEVDPRDTVDSGTGPNLYKEWKITTTVAGDGIFRGSVGPNRRITLVLHGRGNSCTDSSSFNYWTLLVHGRGTPTYTFYGDLGSGGQ